MKRKAPQGVRRLSPQLAGDDIARAVSDLAASVQAQEQRGGRQSLSADLAVGANRVNHELGRKPRGCSVTPTIADATFGWALTSATSTQLVITVVGTGQPGASIEVW